MSKKRSTKDISIKIMNKLKDIEDRLKTLEGRLEGIEAKSNLSLDDQLFFGLVFSLLLLVITFPSIADMVSFFESSELFASSDPSITYAIKMMLIVSLLGSSGYRYYGAIRKSQYAQYQSIHFLLAGICGFSLTVIIVFLGELFFHFFGDNTLTILSLILILIGFGFGVLERVILDFYQTIGQIERKGKIKVEASLWFILIGLTMFIMSFIFVNLRITCILPYPSITGYIVLLVSFLVPFYLIMKNRVKIDSMYEKICRRLRGS